MLETIEDWNGREIAVVRSKGGVLAVCDFADNLIRCEGLPWPPPPVVQKLYESRQSRAFVDDDLAAVTKRLGFYSDLQSINSEDAITWSYFGCFISETAASRAGLLNWLLERTGLAEHSTSERCQLDLWRRIPHPDRPDLVWWPGARRHPRRRPCGCLLRGEVALERGKEPGRRQVEESAPTPAGLPRGDRTPGVRRQNVCRRRDRC